ncbi:MAG TPA: DUF1801 domain-containing protein [Candidatus Dormibacteraeota bacterium]|nr:DUF1801 domain-containing protein [Candidatus Dormibacteraeota bacterium]
MTVDEFVRAKVAPEFKPVVATIRAVMKETAPNAEEVISYGMPVYKGKSLFAWINPPKKDVTLSFTRGAKLEDKYNLLRGTARAGTRHVKMRTVADVNKPALKYYIKQALKLDKA